MTNGSAAPAGLKLRSSVMDSDEGAVRRIVRSTGFFTEPEIEIAAELVRERLERGEASGYEFLFADSGTQAVGYTCWGEIPCTVGSYDLYWIAVDAARRGEGIGGWLLRLTEDRVREAGGRRIYIETSGRELYVPTQGFYLRQGYDLVAKLEEFYAAGDPKLVYAKAL